MCMAQDGTIGRKSKLADGIRSTVISRFDPDLDKNICFACHV